MQTATLGSITIADCWLPRLGQYCTVLSASAIRTSEVLCKCKFQALKQISKVSTTRTNAEYVKCFEMLEFLQKQHETEAALNFHETVLQSSKLLVFPLN